jgi:hypothetical protein|nr:MAG TPA: hypothetical protein [Caudoviricetes sp.]
MAIIRTIETKYGPCMVDDTYMTRDPEEVQRSRKQAYEFCLRAIMNLPEERREVYDVFIRRKYGEEAAH